MTTIILESIHKNFSGQATIVDINLTVEDGEFVAFVGPSGCGKSTLLRMIAGLEPLTSGRILIDGIDISDRSPAERGLAMVFQSYALYPHMSVEGNLAFPLKMVNTSASEIKTRVLNVAKLLDLEPLLRRHPRELSGGQRQRVAIGRAIIRQPKAFLFDEPLSNLDASLRVQTRLELSRLQRSLKIPTIYVTHDQVEAMTMADRIVVLNQGRVEQIGKPMELYTSPANSFVAGFIGSPRMNFITGQRAEHYGASLLGVRPEHLRLAPDKNPLVEGTIVSAEHLGSDTLIYVDVNEIGVVCVRCQGEVNVTLGEAVTLGADAEFLHRFDNNGVRKVSPLT
jgi:multiple sugar transport system ATP-binding protein